MVADKGKKSKVADPGAEGAEPEQHIDGELVLSIEKLQEIQDELERVTLSFAKEKEEKIYIFYSFYPFPFKPFQLSHNSILWNYVMPFSSNFLSLCCLASCLLLFKVESFLDGTLCWLLLVDCAAQTP